MAESNTRDNGRDFEVPDTGSDGFKNGNQNLQSDSGNKSEGTKSENATVMDGVNKTISEEDDVDDGENIEKISESNMNRDSYNRGEVKIDTDPKHAKESEDSSEGFSDSDPGEFSAGSYRLDSFVTSDKSSCDISSIMNQSNIKEESDSEPNNSDVSKEYGSDPILNQIYSNSVRHNKRKAESNIAEIQSSSDSDLKEDSDYEDSYDFDEKGIMKREEEEFKSEARRILKENKRIKDKGKATKRVRKDDTNSTTAA